MTSQLFLVEEIEVPGKKLLPNPKSLATYSHAQGGIPGGIQTRTVYSERQLAVSGNILNHAAMTGQIPRAVIDTGSINGSLVKP